MQVLQVRKKDTERIYAMKILKKSHIIERDEVEHTKSERAILAKNNACPFLVGLKVRNVTQTRPYQLCMDVLLWSLGCKGDGETPRLPHVSRLILAESPRGFGLHVRCDLNDH